MAKPPSRTLPEAAPMDTAPAAQPAGKDAPTLELLQEELAEANVLIDQLQGQVKRLQSERLAALSDLKEAQAETDDVKRQLDLMRADLMAAHMPQLPELDGLAGGIVLQSVTVTDVGGSDSAVDVKPGDVVVVTAAPNPALVVKVLDKIRGRLPPGSRVTAIRESELDELRRLNAIQT